MTYNTIKAYSGYLYSYPHKTAYRIFDKPLEIKNYLEEANKQQAGLYFHIPFCNHKCGFCNLFSKQGSDIAWLNPYLKALEVQAQQVSALCSDIHFTSFAIGGGTPLILNLPQLEKLFQLAELFKVDPLKVFTSIETSPEVTEDDKLQLLKQKGVERLSIGIQSFNPDELNAIKRRHTINTALSALDKIAQANFKEFNIDMIYGIEGQTDQSWLASLKQALQFAPTEIFMYPLYVREGTRITKQLSQEDTLAKYWLGREYLLSEGFTQTSMRRFVKQTSTDLEFSCGDETMISCGCGGRSYIGKLHFAELYAVNQKNISAILSEYMAVNDFTKVQNGIILHEEEEKRRYVIKNLLYYKGLNTVEYNHRYQTIPQEDFKQFNDLYKLGFLTTTNNSLVLTKQGMAYSDYIGQLFISDTIRELMDSYERS